MYNKPMVLGGLSVFVVLFTFPFWYTNFFNPDTGHGHGGKPEGECVESAEWMRANHMLLLQQWRDEVVREGNYTYVNSKGVEFRKGLTNTCLDCHSNKVTEGGAGVDDHGDETMAAPDHVDKPGSKPHGHGPKPAKAMPAMNTNMTKVVGIEVMEANGQYTEATFCAECHQPLNVQPYCWTCHLGPKE